MSRYRNWLDGGSAVFRVSHVDYLSIGAYFADILDRKHVVWNYSGGEYDGIKTSGLLTPVTEDFQY